MFQILQHKKSVKLAATALTILFGSSLFSHTYAMKEEDMNSSSKGNHGRSYKDIHNEMAKKYGFTQHLIPDRAPNQGSNLLQISKDFENRAKKLRMREEQKLEEINGFGKKLVGGGATLAGHIVEKTVEDKGIKGFFNSLIEDGKNFLNSYFK